MKFSTSRRTVLGALTLVLLVYVGLMIVEGRKPALPQVRSRGTSPTGYVLVSMMVDLVEAQLEGAGGWTPNDLPLTPGYWLDNLPSFQIGVMDVVRRASVVLRDDLGRARPTDPPHAELALAARAYAADLRRWSGPSAESMLQRGNDALIRFRQDLGGRAQIYGHTEALLHLVEALAQELDTVDQLLLQASNRDVVPWYKVDDNLYHAQGAAYAAQGLLAAAGAEFPALQQGKAKAALETAVRSLAEGQFEPWVVTTGSKSSLFANHSSRLRQFLEEARMDLLKVAGGLRSGR